MPQEQRFTFGLTILNLVLLAALLSSQASNGWGAQSQPQVLRGRALEIVDDHGRIRANILVRGPETVNGVEYPEAVLLRLMDPVGGPVVKLTASANGAALGLSTGHSGNGGVLIYARDTASFVRIVDKSGHMQMLKP